MTLTIAEEQVMKSRHRVKTYGEVFTPRDMVDRMLDLVGEELETDPDFVDKTFFEPAAGHGNFLVAILRRKLAAIEKRYPANSWPHESLFALASIYGVELLEDNHHEAKAIMLAEFRGYHEARGVACGPRTRLHKAAAYLIDANIIQGDTLELLSPRAQHIQLFWWHRIEGKPGMVQREPFTLASLSPDHGLDFTVYDNYRVCRIDQVHGG